MKSLRIFSLVVLLAASCLAVAHAGLQSVAAAVAVGCRAVKFFVFDGLKLAANESGEVIKSVLPLLQAKAFKARKDKRERPVLSASWRMCPST